MAGLEGYFDDEALQKAAEEQAERAAERRRQLVGAYYRFANSNDGKLILQDLQEFCGHGKSAFNRESDRITDFNLGMQNVMLHIQDTINTEIKE